MGRTAAGTGIAHFAMESNHTSNPKIRLLYIEFEKKNKGGHAYWVWSCLISWIFRRRGYYFDTTNYNELLLFADEHCKLPLDFVQQVILFCVDHSLFDKEVYNRTGALTSERIQLNYLFATYERRRKNNKIVFSAEKWCIPPHNTDISAEKYQINVFMEDGSPLKEFIKQRIIENPEYFPRKIQPDFDGFVDEAANFPRKIEQIPRKIEQIPRKSTHSIVYSNDSIDILSSESTDSATEKEVGKSGKQPEQPEQPKEKKEKPAAKKKKAKPEDTTPFWAEMMEQFNLFVTANFGVKFSWNSTEATNMAKILADLKKRAEDQGKEWNIGVAHLRWQNFLSTAFMDKFLHDNFSPSILYQGRNKVYFNTINQQNGTHTQSPGRSTSINTNGTAGQKPNKSEQRMEIYREILREVSEGDNPNGEQHQDQGSPQ